MIPGRRYIEVLIAILVVVAAVVVLLPAIHHRPHGNARLAVCMSNLRQQGLALATYAAENKGLYLVASDPGELGWPGVVVSRVDTRRARAVRSIKDANELALGQMEWFHCPERTKDPKAAFIDYVSNALDPDGPDSSGVWPSPSSRKVVNASTYTQPSQVILLAEAEKEDRVVDFGDLASVKTAHDQWKLGLTGWLQGGVHNMTVWKGGHLPKGKNGINLDDSPGPRKVTRGMHLGGKRTSALFFDGHAGMLPRSAREDASEKYADWLKRFGVKDPDKVAASDDDLY